ncbi:MAG: hypothetical protein P8130_12150 [Deltaproteobacteria bacterium]
MQLAHNFSPDYHGAACTSKTGGLVVIHTKPDHGKEVAGEAGEPAVPQIIGGAGLAGYMIVRGQETA